ncbi:MAG: hypothetical protein RM338_01815 [Nostoc sp. DedQUE12a]|nr:hypothetical protein [Nostoc sp. DedQUE12a]
MNHATASSLRRRNARSTILVQFGILSITTMPSYEAKSLLCTTTLLWL